MYNNFDIHVVEDAGNDCYHGNNDSTIVPPPPLLSPDGADDSDCGKQVRYKYTCSCIS